MKSVILALAFSACTNASISEALELIDLTRDHHGKELAIKGCVGLHDNGELITVQSSCTKLTSKDLIIGTTSEEQRKEIVSCAGNEVVLAGLVDLGEPPEQGVLWKSVVVNSCSEATK